jgi:mono/diheme cytochrome c family protein
MMPTVQRFPAWLGCLALTGLLAGCNRTTTLMAPPAAEGPPPEAAVRGTFDTESGPFAAGKKGVVASGCFRCHSINGVRGPVGGGAPGPGGPPAMAGGRPGGRGPMGRSRAPDLGKVGKDPAHTVDWLMAYIRNPKDQKPDARMPAFDESKINDDDLRTLAEYLTSLK